MEMASVSTGAVVGQRDLWALAAETLDEDDQAVIKSLRVSGDAVAAVLQQIEQQQQKNIEKEWSFKFRGKEVKVRNVLASILEWVDQFKDAVEFGISMDVSGHAAMPWSCVKFFLELAGKDAKKYGAMLVAMEFVAREIRFYALFEITYLKKASQASEQLADSLVKAYAKLLAHLASAQRYYSQNFLGRGLKALLDDDGVTTMMTDVEKARDIIEQNARLIDRQNNDEGVETMSQKQKELLDQIKTWKEPLESIGETTKQTLETAERVETKVDTLLNEQEKDLIEQHLRTPAHEKTMALWGRFEEDTLKSSGEWLLHDESFKNWEDRKTNFLWISGSPGTGKSFLATISSSHVKRVYPQDSAHPNRVSVASFWIRGDDEDLQDLSSILKSIIYQIAQVDGVFRSHVISVLNIPDSLVTPRKIWENIILAFYKDRTELVNTCLIIIDGLDEAPRETVKAFLALLEDIADRDVAQHRISVEMFARPEISEFFGAQLSHNLQTIEIGERNEADIALFTKQKVLKIAVVKEAFRLKGKKGGALLARDIRDRIMAKADGMFFKVVLIMNQLYDKGKVSAVFESIEAAPPQLEQMISHVFKRLMATGDVEEDDLNELLLWVCYAKRPLNIAELYAILKTRSGKPYDALELDLRKKFASIFKVTGPAPSTTEHDMNTSNANTVLQTNSVNIEDLDIDNLDLSDEDGDSVNNSDATTDSNEHEGASETTDSLSYETMERFWKNDVRFTHASIKDYLLKASRIGTDAPRFDPRTAHLHIVSTIMTSIAGNEKRRFEMETRELSYQGRFPIDLDKKEKAKRSHSNELTFDKYSGSFLLDHLNSIHTKDLPIEERRPVINLICKLFFDTRGLQNLIYANFADFAKTIHRLFADPALVKLLREEWLVYAKESDCSPAEWQWIQDSIKTHRAFLKPLAVQAARMWLSPESEHDLPLPSFRQIYYVWLARCYLDMDSDDSEGKSKKEIDTGNQLTMFIPLEDPKVAWKVAELASVKEDAYFKASMGWMLRMISWYDESISFYLESLKLETDYWPALVGLASCYNHTSRYVEAAECLKKALSLAPKDDVRLISKLKLDSIESMMSTRDFTTAMDSAQASFDQTPCSATIHQYIRCLYARQDWIGIAKAVETLQKSEEGKDWETFRHLVRCHFEIGVALRHLHSIDLIKPMVNRYIAQLSPMTDLIGTVTTADFIYKFYNDDQDAYEFCTKILKGKNEFDPNSELHGTSASIIQEISDVLSSIHLSRAIAAHRDNKDPSQWVDKLMKASLADGGSESNKVYKMNASAKRLAVFLRKYSNAPESIWKPCLLPTVLEGIDMLCDNNPFNDIQAYGDLMAVLLQAGDYENAKAASAACLTEVLYEDDPEARKTLHGLNFNILKRLPCFGLCATHRMDVTQPEHEQLYFCFECGDVFLCGDCIALHRSADLPFRICDPQHEFFQILPWQREKIGVAAVFDREKKTMTVQKEWLEGIRQQWSDTKERHRTAVGESYHIRI